MVEDVNFPERLPAVSATGRIQKVKRKQREDQKPPFEKYLEPEDKEDKKKKKRKKESDKVHLVEKAAKRQRPDSDAFSSSTDPEETDEDSIKKKIDVRV